MENSFSPSNHPQMSEDIRQFAQAFAIAKKSFVATGKSGTNSHTKSSYAKIGDIYNGVEDALLANNIVIWHFISIGDQGDLTLNTRLTHSLSGQYISDARLIKSEKPGCQGQGAAETYMRRYALLSLCSIAAEDDDGQGEDQYIREPNLSDVQVIQLQDAIKAASNASELHRNILAFNKVRALGELKGSAFRSVSSYIQTNRAD